MGNAIKFRKDRLGLCIVEGCDGGGGGIRRFSQCGMALDGAWLSWEDLG